MPETEPSEESKYEKIWGRPMPEAIKRSLPKPEPGPKPLIVRAEVQCPGEEAYRSALLEGLVKVLGHEGIGCDPDVAEPVFRLRVFAPEMMNISFLRGSEARYSRGPRGSLKGCVGFKAGLEVLDARGKIIVRAALDVLDANGKIVTARSDGPGTVVMSYVMVRPEGEFDKDKDTPEQFPAQLEEARQKLPGLVLSNFGHVVRNTRQVLDKLKN
jgi:hypothetical protein